MLSIRLARRGKKKQPHYRITVSEKSKDAFGDHLEIVGHYDPKSKICDVKKDRILYWISQGAKLSPTLNNLLLDQNVITGKKVRASKSRKKKEQKEKAPPPPKATTAT